MTGSVGRRGFIGGSLAVGAVAGAEGAVMLPPVNEPAPLPALPAWFDTLIPADQTPSATALGVTGANLPQGPRAEQMARLLLAGAAWLDAEAKRLGANGFAALDQADRERIAAAAEASPPRSLPRNFFGLTQALAFEQYYVRRESWLGLGGYRGPPQPDGHPDHAEAPE